MSDQELKASIIKQEMQLREMIVNATQRLAAQADVRTPKSAKKVAHPVPQSHYSVFRGLLFAFLSGMIYSLCAVAVKDLTSIHPGQVAVYRYVGITSFSLPPAVYSREKLFGPRKQRSLLLLRAIFGATNVFFHFVAFRYLPLGEATVIIFTLPVFVTVAGRIFLKESFGVLQVISLFTTIVGVVLVTGVLQTMTGDSARHTIQNTYGLAASFASILFGTARLIVLRKLRDVHHQIVMFNCGWVATIEAVIITFCIGKFTLHAKGLQQLLIIAVGILSYVETLSLTAALRFEEAGAVSTMRAAADIILSYIWQIVIFKDMPDAIGVLGAVLVGSSVAIVGLRKWMTMSSQAKCSRFCQL